MRLGATSSKFMIICYDPFFPMAESGRRRRSLQRARSRQIHLALAQALEEFVSFSAAAHADVLVLQHRLDDAQNRFGTQIIGAIKSVHRLKNFVLVQSGILQRTLLEAVV